MILSELKSDVDDASHKIFAGAFGFRRTTATKQEAFEITQNLILSAKRLAEQKGNIREILRNYPNQLSAKKASQHIRHCVDIINLAYAVASERTIEEAPRALRIPGVVEAFKAAFDDEELEEALGKKIFSTCKLPTKGPSLDRASNDFQLSPSSQKLFERYSRDPDLFDTTISKDITAHFKELKYKNPKDPWGKENPKTLVENVVNFLVATQDPTVLANLTIEVRSNGDYLTEGDKDPSLYAGRTFSLFKDPLESALTAAARKKGRKIHALLWLSQLFTDKDIQHNRYNLAKVREQVRKFWHSLYQNLVYAYVFAKEQKKEKSFFNNAFPREKHCSDSLSSMVNAWLTAEKATVGLDPMEAASEKLKLQAQELIDANNVFIGAVVHNFVQFWLTPKFLVWSSAKGHRIGLTDIEKNPQTVLMSYVGAESFADQFAQEVENLVKEAAKKRAVIEFNGNNTFRQGYGVGQEGAYYYTTTDGDLKVEFTLKDSSKSPYKGDQIKVNDIKDTKTLVKKPDYEYEPIVSYLKRKYLEYLEG